MEKKIEQLKLEDLKAVIGGAKVAVSANVSIVRPTATAQLGASTFPNKPATGLNVPGVRF
jgi:hypothetical protein